MNSKKIMMLWLIVVMGVMVGCSADEPESEGGDPPPLVPNGRPVFVVSQGFTNVVAGDMLAHLLPKASDPEDGPLKYALKNDYGGLFELGESSDLPNRWVRSTANLEVGVVPDDTYELVIEATDDQGETATYTLTVNVIEDGTNIVRASEGPIFHTSQGSLLIPENVRSNYLLPRVSGNMLTYSLDDDGGMFVLNVSALPDIKLMYEPFDFESLTKKTYELVITATDAQNETATYTLTVTITDVNEPPRWVVDTTAVRVSVLENVGSGHVIADIPLAIDEDAADVDIVYSLRSTHNNRFALNTTGSAILQLVTGRASLVGQVEFYDVVVQATDSRGIMSENEYTLRVYVGVEAPPPATLEWVVNSTNVSIDENQVDSLLVTVPEAKKPETDPAITYSLRYNFGDRFTFDPDSRELRTGTTLLDYEVETNYEVIVQAESGDNIATYTVEVSLNNLNDNAPVWQEDMSMVSVGESTESNHFLIRIPEASDNDIGDSLTYNLISNFGARFAFDPSSREVKTGTTPLMFSEQSSYDLVIQARDTGGRRGNDYNLRVIVIPDGYQVSSTVVWDNVLESDTIEYGFKTYGLLRSDLKILMGSDLPLTFKEGTCVYYLESSGAILKGIPSSNVTWTNAASIEFVLKIGKEIDFYTNGQIQYAFLTDVHDSIMVGGESFAFKWVSFDANGTLVQGQIRTDQTIDGVMYSANQYIRFYADNGEIEGYDVNVSQWKGERP